MRCSATTFSASGYRQLGLLGTTLGERFEANEVIATEIVGLLAAEERLKILSLLVDRTFEAMTPRARGPGQTVTVWLRKPSGRLHTACESLAAEPAGLFPVGNNQRDGGQLRTNVPDRGYFIARRPELRESSEPCQFVDPALRH